MNTSRQVPLNENVAKRAHEQLSKEQVAEMVNAVFLAFERYWPNLWASRFKAGDRDWTPEALDRLNQTKRAWIGDWEPWMGVEAVKLGLSRIHKLCEMPPSFAEFRKSCSLAKGMEKLDPEMAYAEACRVMPPRENYRWSHISVYHAGVRTGWFELRTCTKKEIFPVFRKHYLKILEEMDQGVEFTKPGTKQIENTSEKEKELSPQENLERLNAMRASLGI